MEEVREINFYGTKDLNGFTYTISLPFKLNNTVREISRRIFDLGGVRI